MPNAPIPMSKNPSRRVTVIGAGKVGSTTAQRLVEKKLADVVLLDIVGGLAEGIALDLMEARGIEGHHCEIIGTDNYAATADSDVVVITAGIPRQPGMSRDDLLKTNGKIVVEASQKAIAHSPNAIFVLVTNPLDVITYLSWHATQLPTQQVIGMAGVLDSSRFQTFIALELGVSVTDVSAMVLGGHGDLMVPLPRYSTVRGVPITELMPANAIARLVDRTRHGGAEIVQLMQSGGAYFAPASSVALMVEAILFNQSRLLPAAAYLQGEYGLEDIFVGVPCRLGRRGVESILELQLTDSEREALHKSAESVRQSIQQALAMLEE